MEADVEKDMVERREITLQPTEQSMEEELVSVQGGHSGTLKMLTLPLELYNKKLILYNRSK